MSGGPSSTAARAPAPGQGVRHAVHGEGRVLRLLDGGRRALVRFTRRPGVPVVVLAEELEPEALVAPEPIPPSTAAHTGGSTGSAAPRATPRDPAGDRQALEALRLGVVPPGGLDSLTVGREVELHALDRLIADRRGMLVLSGHYGTGKTHLLELARAHALDRGLAIAAATFDPDEVPPSHPLRLYGALVRGLRWPGTPAQGLRPLLERVGDSPEHLQGALAHRWLSPALWATHHAPAELAQEVVEFVSGQGRAEAASLHERLRRAGWRGERLLSLPDFRTFGQIMAHLLGGVAVWSASVGQGGLLVLLDEAEYLDRLGSTGRQMAEGVLSYLALACLPDAALAFHEADLYRGGHPIHKRVSPRFTEDQPLAVLCACTPNPDIDRSLSAILLDRRCRLALEPIRPSLLPLLAERVYGLVLAAYPKLDPEPAHRQAVSRALGQAFAAGRVQTPRQAARLIVEFWDLYRLDPRRALRALGAA